MQVVLLAAGLGSRLGSLTESLPKALVQVAGEPLVAHALKFARLLEPSEIIVVGGFEFAQLSREIESRAASVRLVENTSYREGNLLTLMAARPFIHDDFVMLNVDHIYHPAIAGIVKPAASAVTAFIDTDRTLGDDDMKVERDGHGHVHRIAKTLQTWDCGYVGMTRVPAPALSRYWNEADTALGEEGRKINVERILGRLAESGSSPHCRDISGHGWFEVDFPEERERAEAGLRSGRW